MNATVKESPVQQTIREHEDLRQRMAEIRGQVETLSSGKERGSPTSPVGRLVGAVEEFQSLLAAHFAFEEETGLPEELALKLPHVSEKALSLRREHVQILEDLKALATQGRGSDLSRPEEIARYGDRVLRLIEAVSGHEEKETDLIQDAYLNEHGGAD